MEKVVIQPCNQVIQTKSADNLCSLVPCAEKAPHRFYVILVKKARPEFEPKETSTDPRGGPCPGMKGLYSLKPSGIYVSNTDRGQLQTEGDQRDMITKCTYWPILDQRGNKDFVRTTVNNRSSLYIWSCNFSLNLKLFQNELLFNNVCILPYASRRQWVPNWKHNCFLSAETVHLPQGSGHWPECTWSAFFWWLQVTWDHQANSKVWVRALSLLLGRD